MTLSCRATADPSLELSYIWKKDGAEIKRKNSTVIIPDITADEAGVYTCIAYTPDPKRSEDTASAIVSIQGSVNEFMARCRECACCLHSNSVRCAAVKLSYGTALTRFRRFVWLCQKWRQILAVYHSL